MDNTNFSIRKVSEAPDVKFEAEGYIVYDTAGQLIKALSDSFDENPESVIIDMEKVVVFTSVGIRVVVKIYKAAEERGVKFKIINPSEVVINVLKLSGLEKLLMVN